MTFALNEVCMEWNVNDNKAREIGRKAPSKECLRPSEER